MITTLVLPRDAKQKILAPKSSYQPSKKVKDRILEVMQEFSHSYSLMNKPFREYSGGEQGELSVLQRQSLNQKIWNNWQEPRSQDPDEFWKSRAVRGIARNRGISIAAHVTGQVMVPRVVAQDDDEQVDKDAGTVMADLMDWANEDAGYDQIFLYAVIAGIVNPATIIHTEYREVYRTVKEIQENGGWKEKIILDEENSGFCDTLIPLDELFIANIYEHNIQNQPYLIWRRAVDYQTAYQKYNDNTNFINYVRPGIQLIFDEATDSFYEQQDDELENRLVEEVIYYNRFADLQIVFVNGVLLTDPDQPNPRKDKKYPFVKGGYELVDEGKFFYYVSLMDKMSKDVEIAKTLYRMTIDSGYMRIMPPGAIYGAIAPDNLFIPGSMNELPKDAKVEPINIGDFIAGLNLLEKVEANISESSNDILQAGQSIQGSQTAFEISRLEQNARIMLGLFGKMIGFMVRDLGDLRIGDILQYLTIGDVKEIAGKDAVLKYRAFTVQERTRMGKTKARKIELSEGLPENITQRELEETRFALASEQNEDFEVWKVNPSVFRNRKFYVKVTSDIISPPSDNLKRVINLELYDRAIANPLVNQETVTKELLFGSYDVSRGRVDDFIGEQPAGMAMISPGSTPSSVLNKIFGQGKNLELNATI